MTAKVILITGSSGLIGSEVASFFDSLGWRVHGVDNNQRAAFFGPAGDTRWNQERLTTSLRSFQHHELDIRDRNAVLDLVAALGRRRLSTPPPSPPMTARRRSPSMTSTPTPPERSTSSRLHVVPARRARSCT